MQTQDDPGKTGRQRSDSLVRRLREWLTPPQSMPTLQALVPALAGTQLDVFQIDTSTRQLLDPACRRYAFQVLRESGFRNRVFTLGADDVHLVENCGALLLSPIASARWLAAADRRIESAAFGFLYQPFTLSLHGDCVISGRIVPAASQARLPWVSLQPSIVAQRLLLQVGTADAPGNEQNLPAVLRSLSR